MTKTKTTSTNTTDISLALQPIAKKAESIEITDESSLKEAVSLLSQLNQLNDKITEEREKVTKPLNEALKAERARWKPVELANTLAIEAIRSEMSRYQTQLVQSKKEAEEAITARVGQGRGKLKVETAISKLEKLPDIEKEHATEAGLVQFREKKVLKIIDVDMIHREYMIPDEFAILEALKAGKTVLGCELETIQVPVNYR